LTWYRLEPIIYHNFKVLGLTWHRLEPIIYHNFKVLGLTWHRLEPIIYHNFKVLGLTWHRLKPIIYHNFKVLGLTWHYHNIFITYINSKQFWTLQNTPFLIFYILKKKNFSHLLYSKKKNNLHCNIHMIISWKRL
jgi:hypothetical protein